MFLSAQSVCAKLRTGPIIMQILGAIRKNSLLCRKSAIFSIRWKKPPFWGLPSGPKKLKKLTGALGCMHKAPKCIQSLWDHPKKIPFVQKYKESAICAILREKNPILGHSQRLKKVFLSAQSVCARLRTGPIIMQIPRGYQKKQFIV